METTKSPLHIAIIGAGIGGLALAIGLLHENVPYTLYEAAGEYAMIGAGVGLGPNAMRAMDMIDKRFGELYKGISTGNMTPNREHVMMDILLMEEGLGKQRGWDGKPIEAERYTRTSAHRKALLDIMTSMIPLSTVKFNKRVKTMKHVGDHVVITFSDGEVVEASAVIGCDGAKGASRAAVLGETHPELVEATYSKKYVYRSIVPMKDAEEILGFHARDAKLFMGHQSNFMTFPIANGNQYNVVAFKLTEEPWTHDQWTKEVSREEMLGDFAEGCDKRLVKLLDVSCPANLAIPYDVSAKIMIKLTMISGRNP
jgi:salicylate hydroxylase